jgi:hypothetical protein
MPHLIASIADWIESIARANSFTPAAIGSTAEIHRAPRKFGDTPDKFRESPRNLSHRPDRGRELSRELCDEPRKLSDAFLSERERFDPLGHP